MLNMLRKRQENEEGFTLIELMVVVLIIAILLAIAIPTFLGAQNRAKERAVQSDLRNALTAAKTIATDHEGYFLSGPTTAINAATLFAAESSQSFVDTTATVDKASVTVAPATGENITLVKKSKAKDAMFWGIKATKDGEVFYCKAAAEATLLAGCTSTSFSAVP